MFGVVKNVVVLPRTPHVAAETHRSGSDPVVSDVAKASQHRREHAKAKVYSQLLEKSLLALLLDINWFNPCVRVCVS